MAVADVVFQFTHLNPESKYFERQKQQLIHDAKKQFLNVGLEIDIEKSYRRQSSSSQIRDHARQTLLDHPAPANNFAAVLLQKEQALDAIKQELNHLNDQLINLQDRQQRLNDWDKSVTEEFNNILQKIEKIRHDKTYSILKDLANLASTIAMVYKEPTGAAAAQAASMILGYINAHKMQKTEKKLNDYREKAECLCTRHQQVTAKSQTVSAQIYSTLRNKRDLESAQMYFMTAKEHRTALENKINTDKTELEKKQTELKKLLDANATFLAYINGSEALNQKLQKLKHTGRVISYNNENINSWRTEMDKNDEKIKPLSEEIRELEIAQIGDNAELTQLNGSKYVDDYIDAATEEELYGDCKDEDPNTEKQNRERRKEEIKQVQNFNANLAKLESKLTEKEQSYAEYRQLAENSASLFMMMGRYADLAQFKRFAWGFTKTSYAIQSALLGHQAYLKLEQIAEKVGETISQVLSSTIEQQQIPSVSLLPSLISFFTQPVFSAIQIGDKLVQSLANLFFGIELFGDPVFEIVRELPKQLSEGFTKLSEQVQQNRQQSALSHYSLRGAMLQSNDKQDRTLGQIAEINHRLGQAAQTTLLGLQDDFNQKILSKIEDIHAVTDQTVFTEEILAKLLRYMHYSSSQNYSTSSALLISTFSPFQLINTLAPEISPAPLLLCNYYMLHPIAELIIKQSAKFNAVKNHPTYMELKQLVKNSLTSLIAFSNFLYSDPSWLFMLDLAIRYEFAAMFETIAKQTNGKDIKEGITPTAREQVKAVREDYSFNKTREWRDKLQRENQTVYSNYFVSHFHSAPTYKGSDKDDYSFKPPIAIVKLDFLSSLYSKVFYVNSLEAKMRDIPPSLKETFSKLNTHLNTQYQLTHINSGAVIHQDIVNGFNALLQPLFKNWISYYHTANAVSVLFKSETENSIELKQPIHDLGKSLAFFEALRQDDLKNSVTLMKPVEAHGNYAYYLSFLNSLSSTNFSTNPSSLTEVVFIDQHKRKFSGIPLEDTANAMPPLLFPPTTINDLKQRPELKLLFLAEELQVAMPFITYSFEQSSDKKEYFLSIEFSYLLVEDYLFGEDNRKNIKPFIRFHISRFDYISVHATAALSFNEDNTYNFKLNPFRFLVMAMFGGLLAGLGSYDLSRTHDLSQNKSLIFANAVLFKGVFKLLSENPGKLIYFDSVLYRPVMSTSPCLQEYFNFRDIKAIPSPEVTPLKVKIQELTQALTKKMHDSYLAEHKLQLETSLEKIDKLYHLMVHTFKLYTNINYEEATQQIADKLHLPHPLLSSNLFKENLNVFLSIHGDYLLGDAEECINKLHAFMRVIPHPFLEKMKDQKLNLKEKTFNQDANQSIQILDFDVDNSYDACLKQLKQSLLFLQLLDKKELVSENENKPVSKDVNESYFQHFNREKLPYSIYHSKEDSFYNLQEFSQVLDYLKEQFTNYFNEKVYTRVTRVTNVTVNGYPISTGAVQQVGLRAVKQVGLSPHRNSCALAPLRFLNKEAVFEDTLTIISNTFHMNPWQKTYIQPLTDGIRYYLLAFNFVTPTELRIYWHTTSRSSDNTSDHIGKLLLNSNLQQRFPFLSPINIYFFDSTMQGGEKNACDNGALILHSLQETLILCKNATPFMGFHTHPSFVEASEEIYLNNIKQIRNLHKTYIYLHNKTNEVFNFVSEIQRQFDEKIFKNAGELKQSILTLSLNDLATFLQRLEEISSEDYWEAYSEDALKAAWASLNPEVVEEPSRFNSTRYNPNFFAQPASLKEQFKSKFNLEVIKIPKDGHCMFLAIAEQIRQIDGTEYSVETLRELAVNALKDNEFAQQEYKRLGHRELTSFDDYLDQMKKGALYGDHFTLQALATTLGKDILILEEKPNAKDQDINEQLTCTVIHKNDDKTEIEVEKTILLYFLPGEVHYNAFKKATPTASFPNEKFMKFLRMHNVISSEAEQAVPESPFSP